MLPEEIISILNKYKDEVPEEISNINQSIKNISSELQTISIILVDMLRSYAKNTGTRNTVKESELLKDSQKLRDYIDKIYITDYDSSKEDYKTNNNTLLPQFSKMLTSFIIVDTNCPICKSKLIKHCFNYEKIDKGKIKNRSVTWYRCPNCNDKIFVTDQEAAKFSIKNTNIQFSTDYYNKCSFYDTIVIFNINKCSAHNHKIKDVICELGVILPNGEIEYKNIPIIYCKTCHRYIMLKSTYDNLGGIPLCIINNETKSNKEHTKYDFMHHDKGGSKLYQYGYNVNCTDKLTPEQRHVILLTQLLSKNLTKAEIYSTLDTNINNGLKRKDSKNDWSNAVLKWQSDRKYVEDLDLNLPYERINISRLILKYKVK